tara:strand:- start:23969 stop:25351 length:1383 start_codon:yes stop_codon:yes gene_type:complete
MNRHHLFDEFREVSAKAWKQQVQFDLQGADYNEKLVWESPEGIKVKPFYHADDLKALPATAPSGNRWQIAQPMYAGNATMANEKALQALSQGVESLLFTVPTEEVSFSKLLKAIELDRVPVHIGFGFLSLPYLQTVLETGAHPNLFLHVDSIGHLAKTGNWHQSLEKDLEILRTLIAANSGGPVKNLLSVDLGIYQNAGANMVQQLAYSLAHANEYLNHLFSHKLHTELKGISFKVAVGSNYFFEIAKIRALRILWKSLCKQYGIDVECHILATPGMRNKTLYDYNVNMLRTTTECMSAILGGADTVYNRPYDACYRKANVFSERIARNQLLLLRHESFFDRASNPADGAYYIEELTAQLAAKSLELFKQLEAAGGFLVQLKSHNLQKKIKESAQKEQALFDAQKEVLIGTNKYPDPKDRMKDALQLYPFVKINARKTLLEPIIGKRLSEASEQKRLKDE